MLPPPVRFWAHSLASPSRFLPLLKRPTSVLTLTMIANILLRTVSTIILTRLLSPAIFGLAGIISSVMFTIIMLTDLGFQRFVVRHPKGDEAHFRNVIWTVHAVRGLALTLLAFICAPWIGTALQKPELVLPLAIACLQLAIDGFASIAIMAALRENGANKLSLLDLGLAFFQTILCIALAVWLRSIWAIVYAGLASRLLRTVLSYAIFHNARQRPANDTAIRREFFVFSRVVMASSFLTLVISQSDKFFLGRVFTLEEFGLYAIAINLALVPASFVDAYVSRIVYPAYAKIWATCPEQIASAFYAVRQKISILFALGSGTLIGVSPLLVRILYDPRYEGAAIFLSILACASALRLPTASTLDLMIAIGKIKLTLYVNIVRATWLCVMGTLGYLLAGGFGIVIAVGTLEVPALICCWCLLYAQKVINFRKELTYIALVCGSALFASLTASFMMQYFIQH